MDRGFFDSLCWFEWQKVNGYLRDQDYKRFTEFFTAPRFRMMIDLVFLFESSSATSIEREYRNLLTRKEGSIMRQKVLEGYVAAIQQAAKKYRNTFRAMESMNTDERDQNQVSFEVTRRVLSTLNVVADEKIGYVPRKALNGNIATVFRYSEIKSAIDNNLMFDFRDKIEPDEQLVQFIPVAVFKDKAANRFITGRKALKAVSPNSPERDRILLYFGGHVREEDSGLFHHPPAIEVMKQCMYREVKEEIGIDIDAPDTNPFCIWVRDGTKSERHIAVVFLLERDIDEVKIAIDDEEFVRWEKKGTPGTGDIIDESGLRANVKSLDSWSRNIIETIAKVELNPPKTKPAQSELRLG
jgi:predicted NUDIX family phosphoesterase